MAGVRFAVISRILQLICSEKTEKIGESRRKSKKRMKTNKSAAFVRTPKEFDETRQNKTWIGQ
jgi:hypothetical protein